MYLKRLDITGFKSFAAKTTFNLEPGLTAIVGPNGSGKSNLADAIRWALGEQAKNQLRLKSSQELVFAGTRGRPRASLAEVSLLLDNSDDRMEVRAAEVELSRRLYRSGETEFQLNRQPIKLQDAHQLLIQAGFGPNSYTIIAQGTIDSFILATPAERKLLFEEASGIRQYELRREKAVRKLEVTDANLTRINDILSELQPRLKDLERTMAAVRERESLQAQLEHQRAVIIVTAESTLPRQKQKLQQLLKQQSSLILKLQQGIKGLESKQADLSKHQTNFNNERLVASKRLHVLEGDRDQLSNDISVKRAELRYVEERAEVIAALNQQVGDIENQIKTARNQLAKIAKNHETSKLNETVSQQTLNRLTANVTSAQNKLNRIRQKFDDTGRHEYLQSALALVKHLSRQLSQEPANHQELKLLVYKTGRLLSLATGGQSQLLADLKKLQLDLTSIMKARDEAHEAHAKIVIKLRSIELDQTYAESRLAGLEDQHSALQSSIKEQPKLDPKIITNRQRELTELEARLRKTTNQLHDQRAMVSDSQPAGDPQAIFALAAELEATRTELVKARSRYDQISEELHQLSLISKHYQTKAKSWFRGPLPSPEVSDQDLQELERQAELLESRLTSSAAADSEVIEEFAQVKQRHDYLTEQLLDLRTAQADIGGIIGQLEALIKTKFEEAFAAISSNFNTYFTSLFSGGRAVLTLKQDSDGVYGIEIKAVPPGKRVEALASLSGGERSLTGIALLAAILKVNPSPFVVLDEVDAALDEANSLRLAQILSQIAKQTQLIVITHNRTTMQAAHALFGVTMDECQVSRVLSLKLQDAHALAPAE
jgi:chromosome segregation protein